MRSREAEQESILRNDSPDSFKRLNHLVQNDDVPHMLNFSEAVDTHEFLKTFWIINDLPTSINKLPKRFQQLFPVVSSLNSATAPIDRSMLKQLVFSNLLPETLDCCFCSFHIKGPRQAKNHQNKCLNHDGEATAFRLIIGDQTVKAIIAIH